jgi:hypothetical protein
MPQLSQSLHCPSTSSLKVKIKKEQLLIAMSSIIMISFVTVCILMGPFAGDVLAGEVGSPVKAIYGFSRKHHAVQGKTLELIAHTLKGWGVTAVFGGGDTH